MKRIAFLLTMVMLLVLLVACTEPTPETYTIDFIVKGETISQVYEKGATPTPPTVEDYETINQFYTFTGWDKEIVAVTEDATYTAQFTGAIKEFDVTFIFGGNTTGTPVKVPFGATPDAPTTGLNYQTADKVYTFIGWDKALAPITADTVYTAKYSSVAREYDVTFKYGDPANQTSTTIKVAYGSVPTAPTEGLSWDTTDKSYTFKAWDKTVSAVTGDVTYTATYEESARKYIVTLNYNGTTENLEVAYNSIPSLPTPTATYVDTESGLTYVFVSWDKAASAVTDNQTYTAIYDVIIYSEIFDDEDDFDSQGATKAFGAWSFAIKADSYVKSRVDANAASNKILELKMSGNAEAAQIGIKSSTGLAMGGRTKLTISFDLGKIDGVRLSDSYVRFRSTTSKYVKFLVTAQTDNSIAFCGTKLTDSEGNLIALSETLKNFRMEFDFATGKASIAVDGVVLVADADLYNEATTGWKSSHGTDMVDYIGKCTEYVFQWAINKKSMATGMLLDNMMIVAHN